MLAALVKLVLALLLSFELSASGERKCSHYQRFIMLINWNAQRQRIICTGLICLMGLKGVKTTLCRCAQKQPGIAALRL